MIPTWLTRGFVVERVVRYMYRSGLSVFHYTTVHVGDRTVGDIIESQFGHVFLRRHSVTRCWLLDVGSIVISGYFYKPRISGLMISQFTIRKAVIYLSVFTTKLYPERQNVKSTLGPLTHLLKNSWFANDEEQMQAALQNMQARLQKMDSILARKSRISMLLNNVAESLGVKSLGSDDGQSG